MQKILKNEKGAISLFILLTALFFLVVVTSVGVSFKNKEAQIDSQFEKIKLSYEKDVGQEYNEATADEDLTEEEKKEREIKKTSNIGKKVNFVSKYSNELIWRLFYADDDYVYLIASKIGNNGIDENSNKIEDKFSYFKSSVINNLEKINQDIDLGWEDVFYD